VKVVIQRVTHAGVNIDGNVHAEIKNGLVVFIGIENADKKEDIEWLVNKIAGLRIFNDAGGVMNLNITDIKGEIMVISQFTLHAGTKKGNRPSYIKAAKPEIAVPLYNEFISSLSDKISDKVRSGVFGADMKVELINDGPVTIIIDTKNKV